MADVQNEEHVQVEPAITSSVVAEGKLNPLLLDMILYLQAKGLVEGDGVDAYRDFMPDQPDNVVTLVEYKGDAVSRYCELVNRSVQIKVRNLSADEARKRALTIFETFRTDLAEDARIQFTEERWGQLYLRQTPFKLHVDEHERTTWCFNVGVTTTIY